MDLLDTCLAETGRDYPPGYGFALAYLTESPGVDQLKVMREQAVAAVARSLKSRANLDDAAAFTLAVATAPPTGGWPYWLVEATQLVLQDALSGNAKSGKVLAQWDHPGWPKAA